MNDEWLSTITRPSRSRMRPRAARMGTLLMLLACAELIVKLGVLHLQPPEARDQKHENGNGGVLKDGNFPAGVAQPGARRWLLGQFLFEIRIDRTNHNSKRKLRPGAPLYLSDPLPPPARPTQKVGFRKKRLVATARFGCSVLRRSSATWLAPQCLRKSQRSELCRGTAHRRRPSVDCVPRYSRPDECRLKRRLTVITLRCHGTPRLRYFVADLRGVPGDSLLATRPARGADRSPQQFPRRPSDAHAPFSCE